MPLACTGPATQTWRLLFLAYVLILVQSSAIAYVTTRSPLQLLNPWVSACDLATPATAPDLQGTCSTIMQNTDNNTNNINSKINTNNNDNNKNHHSNNETVNPNQRGPGPPLSEDTYACPSVCPGNYSSTNHTHHTNTSTTVRNNQCLYYLDDSHKAMVCGASRGGWKRDFLRGLRLRHCCEHSVFGALSDEGWKAVEGGDQGCHVFLAALIELDALAARVACEFNEILMRYDCGQAYSVNHACEDCKEAYRQWVCSSLIPHFATPAKRIRPCRDVCQKVEQRCPYFLPGDRAPSYPTQYAGEPTFLCLDPNIPETGEQLVKSSYGPRDCCYTNCGAQGICATHLCAVPTNHSHHPPCSTIAPATVATTPVDASGRTVISACAATTNYGQVQLATSGTSRLLLLDNNCWIMKLIQFYVVTNIMNLLLYILFSLVRGLERIYVFGYT